MSDRQQAMRKAFLEDIIAHSDDDTPRLIFADWLDDHGEPERAEFIRVQCEIARMDQLGLAAAPRERRALLLAREIDLWNAKGKDGWLVDLSPGLRRVFEARFIPQENLAASTTADPVIIFRRGFAESAACSEKLWLDHGKTLAGQQPIQTVRLTDRAPYQSKMWMWANWTMQYTVDESQLSPLLLQHLAGEKRSWHESEADLFYWGYPSSEDALADLSAACIRFAREAA